MTLPQPDEKILAQVVEMYPNPDDPIREALWWFLQCWEGAVHDGREYAVEEFLRLLQGEPLIGRDNAPDLVAPAPPVNVQRVWAPLKQYPEASDIARVRPDLLSSKGWTLNGRVGKIAGMRRGDVILVFDREVPDGPPEYRGPVDHFEVDISSLQQ